MQQIIKMFVLASMLVAGAVNAEDAYLSLTISNPQEVEVHVDGVQKKNCCSGVAVVPLAFGSHRIVVKSHGYEPLEWILVSPGNGSTLVKEVRLIKSGDSTVAVPTPPVVDASECITEGTMAGKKAWREFKWGAGGDLCAKLTEVNTLVTEIYKDNPITPCDNAFNDAVGEYVDEQVDKARQSKECATVPPIVVTQPPSVPPHVVVTQSPSVSIANNNVFAQDLVGHWIISHMFDGKSYPHDMYITKQSSGIVSGNGGFPAGQPKSNTWIITDSSVNELSIRLTVVYTSGAPGTVMHMTGDINQDGSVIRNGAWDDNYGGVRKGTWEAFKQ